MVMQAVMVWAGKMLDLPGTVSQPNGAVIMMQQVLSCVTAALMVPGIMTQG
jgi:hypothetical protein